MPVLVAAGDFEGHEAAARCDPELAAAFEAALELAAQGLALPRKSGQVLDDCVS